MKAAQAGRDRGAGELVIEVQLHQWREAQAQAGRVSFRECDSQRLVKKKAGFEVRTGGRVFNRTNALAQVEALGAFFRDGQQALQAATQVGGLGDVGFRALVATQEKDRRLRGDGGEDLLVAACIEVKPVEKHRKILVGEWGSGTGDVAEELPLRP